MSATDGLCCCEYENLDGERSHILACCCDCDALDQIVDRCFKCEKIPDGMVQRFFNTLNDRCRFPGICGKGAVRMNLDIIVPCCFVVAKNNTHDRVDDILSQEIAEKDVTWVDSRPIKDGKLKIWCENCHFKKPARSGHCNICNACISVRDHHCVWIDCCIGSHNHRSFIITMALFLFCGFYGFHLTMTTVCTPEMYLGWFLFPSDCRFLYIDFQTAVSFVAACYTLMASMLMMCNFIYQIVLISQNTTSQEFHQASRRGLRTKCFTVKNNIHNNGFIKNWIAFIFTRREDTGNIP
ncbi:ZDHHC [Mytilus edulis]|uniref:Palmitoyltransferase n=1 Tax=Mytilus edulis TaxID=6550 RepID=A0A8S3QPC2_MYTED|nr:ZDHHC [Mytilus edulis]